MRKIDPSTLDLKDKVVTINRVSKTVKGGRTMRFSALVVVGDENGHVGCGMGKAAEIPDAIRKGKEAAIKNIIKVEMNDVDSIYHGVTGEYGSASVLLMPAPEGTGRLNKYTAILKILFIMAAKLLPVCDSIPNCQILTPIVTR